MRRALPVASAFARGAWPRPYPYLARVTQSHSRQPTQLIYLCVFSEGNDKRRVLCENIASPGDWRSGSAGPLQGQGRGFKSLIAHHLIATGPIQAGWGSFSFGDLPQIPRNAKRRPEERRIIPEKTEGSAPLLLAEPSSLPKLNASVIRRQLYNFAHEKDTVSPKSKCKLAQHFRFSAQKCLAAGLIYPNRQNRGGDCPPASLESSVKRPPSARFLRPKTFLLNARPSRPKSFNPQAKT